MYHTAIYLLLALLVPVGTPSPAPTDAPALRTITTVTSSPYCTSLAQHFNGAFVPMLGNDRSLAAAGGDLESIDDLFKSPDYVSKFIATRKRLAAEVDAIQRVLPHIQAEIAALRAGESLTKDATEAAAVHDAADDLQRAWVKQHAMAIDLQGIVQSMMDYPIFTAPRPLGGTSPADNAVPPDRRNIKSYLRFDGQRDVIAQAEEKAVDTAYNAASTACRL